jgi:hypothetical protein
MENLNIYLLGCIVLVSQIIFLYLRTLNIKAIAQDKMVLAILTGTGIGITWMIGIAIGTKAMLKLEWFPILMHLIGGAIGTIIAMRKKKKDK